MPANVPSGQEAHPLGTGGGTDSNPWPKIQRKSLYQLDQHLATDLAAKCERTQETVQSVKRLVSLELMVHQPAMKGNKRRLNAGGRFLAPIAAGGYGQVGSRHGKQ